MRAAHYAVTKISGGIEFSMAGEVAESRHFAL
jgi:hypothetical protein